MPGSWIPCLRKHHVAWSWRPHFILPPGKALIPFLPSWWNDKLIFKINYFLQFIQHRSDISSFIYVYSSIFYETVFIQTYLSVPFTYWNKFISLVIKKSIVISPSTLTDHQPLVLKAVFAWNCCCGSFFCCLDLSWTHPSWRVLATW